MGTFEDFTQRYTELGEDAKQQILAAEQALTSYRAGSAFAENIEAFQQSINAAGITVAAINQAFADLQPTLRSEYERLRAEIIGTDGVIDASEQLILERQGLDTFENFTAPFAQLRDTAITSVETAETALANYVESSNFTENVNAFRSSLSAAGLTVADVNTAWQRFVNDTLRPEYERLRAGILDDDGIVSATEELELRRAGVFSFEDFSGQFSGIRDSAIDGITTAETALANYIDDSNFEGNVEAFRTSITAAGVTVEDVNTAWETFVENTLRPEYERLRGLVLDDDGIISASEEFQLRRLGVFSFQDFSSRFVGIKDSAISGIETAAEALSSHIAESEFETNVQAFRTAISEAGLTIEDVNTQWGVFVENVLRPEFERIRSGILDDDGIISASEELELRSAGVFNFEDFTAGFVGIKDAAIEGIQTASEALANYVAESNFEQNVNAFRSSVSGAGITIEDVNTAWATFQETVLRPEFERIRGLILDDDGVIDATEEFQLRQAGVFTFEDFASRFVGIKDAAVSGITTAEDALASYIAESNFEANVNTFRSAISAAGNTVADINAAWSTFVENVLRPEFERLRGEILDDDGIIDATEELALRSVGLFTFEDFSGQFSGLRDSAITGIQTSEQALASFRAGSTFSDNIDAFKATVEAVGVTVETINQALIDLQPVLQAEFERLRNEVIGADGIISTAEQLILEQRGLDTFENFAQPFLNIAETASSSVTTRAAQSRSNLSQNAVQRAEFGLQGATDEADFETRRGILRQATETYYSAEETRINGLMLSENELRDLREDNSLARERALERIDDLDNEFTQDRIRREQEVADAAIQASERAARAQEQQFREQQQRRFALEDIGIGSQRGIEDLIRSSAYVDTLSDQINRQLSGFGLDQREGLVQDLSGRFGVQTEFAGGEIRVGGQAFAPGEDLQVQSAEEIRRQLTPIFSSLADNINIEELNDLILGIQSQQRDAIRGIEDENRESQRDTVLESMNAEILNNSWKSDIAQIAANTALDATDSAYPTDPTLTGDPTEIQEPTTLPTTTPVLETPAIQEVILQASQAILTVENLELAALDASTTLLNESALAHMKAADKHSGAADKHSTAADALLNAASALADSLGAGIAQGNQPLNLIVQWGSGETTQVAGEIQQGIADGSILPFASGGGG